MDKKKLNDTLSRIHSAVTSSQGHEVLLFVVFVLIAYVFWLILTLNNEVQEDVDVPVELCNVPDSVTIISDIPGEIKVSVRDKGVSLIKYKLSDPKPMKLSWADYTNGNNKLLVTRADLGARLREYFGANSQISSVTPDSIRVIYTTNPGRQVAVNVVSDLRPVFGSIINGPITADIDSVMLYSVHDLPLTLTEVETMPVVRTNLSDTTLIVARIKEIDGVRIVPNTVTLTVPVEPLISRRQIVSVVTKNLPSNYKLITFPSYVELNYLIPMSQYNSKPYEMKAYVDYLDTHRAHNGKLPVTLSLLPEYYHNTDMTPDSVEFIIEKRAATP